jgi:hypothetical protein
MKRPTLLLLLGWLALALIPGLMYSAGEPFRQVAARRAVAPAPVRAPAPAPDPVVQELRLLRWQQESQWAHDDGMRSLDRSRAEHALQDAHARAFALQGRHR